jgi:transcriptional regulator with XRE-family HTH domain
MFKPTTNAAGHARFALVAALYKQQLGEVIKARRKELGLTQKNVADRANIEEPQTVSRWERGLNSPTDLDAVARALEWTVDEMLRQLTPLGQKARRGLDPHGPTQLDRIEERLAEILLVLRPQSPGEVAEEAARHRAERRRAAATARGGKKGSDRAA